MSGFMSYLNKINSQQHDYEEDIEEEVVDDVADELEDELEEEEEKVVVEKVITKSKSKPIQKPVKVDESVTAIEERLRYKLDNVGLNSKMINDVVSYVLFGVKTIKGSTPSPVQNKTSVNTMYEFSKNNDIASAAGFILEGVPDTTHNPTPMNNSGGSVVNSFGGNKMSSVADHASSLL